MRLPLGRILWALVVIVIVPISVVGQENDIRKKFGSSSIEEIVVTSSRLREEPVQDVPLGVAEISSEQIDKLKILDIGGLSSLAPNLTITQMGPSAGAAAIGIRGFVTAASDIAIEPGVAVYVDGIYQVINTGSLTDMYDLESIEILREPQGALLGKSSGAGALLLRRSRPTGDLLAAFLASEVAGWITDQTIFLDGGYTHSLM